MQPLRASVAFRDRSIADVLDLALRFLVVRGRSYIKVSAVTLFPLLAIAIAAGRVLGWPHAWAIVLPLSILAEVPFTVLASRLVFEDDVRARDIVLQAMRSTPRVVFLRVVSLLLVALGLVLLFFPGMWLAAIFLFLGEVTLLERGTLGQTFARAQRVASSSFSEVILSIVILALIPVASVFLADIAGRGIIGEVLQFRPPQAVWTAYGSDLATLGLFLQAPFLATARFFLYLNIRTRTEGWDIQTRFYAISQRLP